MIFREEGNVVGKFLISLNKVDRKAYQKALITASRQNAATANGKRVNRDDYLQTRTLTRAAMNGKGEFIFAKV